MTSTPLRELVEHDMTAAGHDLKQTVKAARKAGESWQAIAYRIKDQTGRTVTAETVRRWYHIT